MKTTLGIIAVSLVGTALVACHHDQPPATSASSTSTYSASAYQPEQQQPVQQQPLQQPSQQSTSANHQSSYDTHPYDETPSSSSLSNDRAYGSNDTWGGTNSGSASNSSTSKSGSSSSATTSPSPNEPIDPSLAPAQSSANAKADTHAKKGVVGATDQGNAKSEVKISATIRKQMMASKTLSFGAKNVKVITNGTKVTLKGTVKTDAEKNEIEGIARNADGVTDVDDQLVVKK